MVEKSSKEEGHEHAHQSSDFKNAMKNPWIVSTVVLGVVALILLVIAFRGTGEIGAKNAADNFLAYVKANGADATYVSADKEGSMYKVTVKYQGQDIPVYVSLDGKYLIAQPIPLTSSDSSSNSAQQTQKATPKNDKPVVELFIMSHCPYGTQEQKGILPVANLLGDKIDFKVRWVSYAMHGIDEVNENTNQYCIQKDQKAKYSAYLQCYLGSSGSAADATKCRTTAGINEATLKTCFDATNKAYNITGLFNDKSTWLNGNYPQYNVDKNANEQYGVQGSPTLVINGVEVSTGRDSVSLLNAICGAFNNAPSECNTKLDATSPGPGFGWDTAGSNNLATCG